MFPSSKQNHLLQDKGTLTEEHARFLSSQRVPRKQGTFKGTLGTNPYLCGVLRLE